MSKRLGLRNPNKRISGERDHSKNLAKIRCDLGGWWLYKTNPSQTTKTKNNYSYVGLVWVVRVVVWVTLLAEHYIVRKKFDVICTVFGLKGMSVRRIDFVVIFFQWTQNWTALNFKVNFQPLIQLNSRGSQNSS